MLAESILATRNDIDSALDPTAATTLCGLFKRLAVLDGLDDQARRLQNRWSRHVPAAYAMDVKGAQSPISWQRVSCGTVRADQAHGLYVRRLRTVFGVADPNVSPYIMDGWWLACRWLQLHPPERGVRVEIAAQRLPRGPLVRLHAVEGERHGRGAVLGGLPVPALRDDDLLQVRVLAPRRCRVPLPALRNRVRVTNPLLVLRSSSKASHDLP